MNSQLESKKEKLVLEAENFAIRHLLSRFGNGKISKESSVDLSFQNNPISNALEGSGHVNVFALAETPQGYENLNLSIALADGAMSVESETTLQETNAQPVRQMCSPTSSRMRG